MIKYYLSKFAHYWININTIVLFHSVNLNIIYLDNEYVELINKIFNEKEICLDFCDMHNHTKEKEIIDNLLSNSFLVEDINSDSKLKNDLIKRYLPEVPDIKTLYLILTKDCNYKCIYCFEGEVKKEEHMSKQVIKSAIDVFFRIHDSRHDPKIVFYGGEPLLNKEGFKYALEYLEEYKRKSEVKRIYKCLITNGSLIDEEIALYIKKYDVFCCVSLDGYKEINDIFRKVDNDSAFDLSYKGINHLMTNNINFGIAITIYYHNINYIIDIIKFFHEKLNVKHFGINYATDFPKNKIKDSFYDDFIEKFCNLFDYFFANDIYEENLFKIVNAIIEKDIIFKNCAAYGQQISVNTDGKYFPCQAFCQSSLYFNNDIENLQNIQDYKEIWEWHKKTPFLEKECNDCLALGLCGGGCFYQNYLRNSPNQLIDEVKCKITKNLIKCILNYYIENLNNIDSMQKEIENV